MKTLTLLILSVLAISAHAEIIDGRNIDTTPNKNVIPPREDTSMPAPPEIVKITTGVIDSRCLYSWDDSQQFHSESIHLELGHQSAKTTMKPLHHCIRLTVTGPIDIQGIAKSYVERCIDYGLKKNSTRHALEGIAAIAADIFSGGATVGSITMIKVADYTKSVTDNIIECLVDTKEISFFMQSQISSQIKSTVKSESEWRYWDI